MQYTKCNLPNANVIYAIHKMLSAKCNLYYAKYNLNDVICKIENDLYDKLYRLHSEIRNMLHAIGQRKNKRQYEKCNMQCAILIGQSAKCDPKVQSSKGNM